MLKLFDDIDNPYSPSGDRSGSISMHSTGMGQRILSDNKGHDWEELLLMVSNEKTGLLLDNCLTTSLQE